MDEIMNWYKWLDIGPSIPFTGIRPALWKEDTSYFIKGKRVNEEQYREYVEVLSTLEKNSNGITLTF